ncbi:MAG: alpha-2-macroglobulin family protein [Patescibacteria group bacterium]|jgi:hypothetical protein
MNERNTRRAAQLDDALSKQGDVRHDNGIRPLVETARAVKKDASAPTASLNPTTAKNQRIMLMNMANATAPAPTPVPSPSTPPASARKPWFVWAGSAVAIAAIALIAVVTLNKPTNVFSPTSREALARLIIPEVHAGDAFSLIAESEDAGGASVDTTFKVTSKVAVTAEGLKQYLHIVPPVPFSIDEVGNGEFRVRPEESLAGGEVYRLAVNTAVQKEDGTLTAREFSWAVQTKDIFRILTSVPGDGSNGVPLDTGIEVTMSQTGWEDPKATFSISPNVEGRFETHGRSLAFIPSKPLQPGQLYTVTYKKGWRLADSDLALTDDQTIRFETLSAAAAQGKNIIRVEPTGTLFETAPGKEAFIQAYMPYGGEAQKAVELTGFVLTKDEAKNVLTEVGKIPWWADATKKRGDVYVAAAKKEAFKVTAALEGDGYPTYLRMPGVAAGVYVVRINPPAVEGATVEASWFVLQATEIATFTLSDEKTTLVWAMNVATNRPMTGAAVRLKDSTVTTGDDGVARLNTPSELVATSTDGVAAIAEITSGSLTALVPLEKSGGNMPFDFGWNGTPSAHDTTWGYVFTDRPLYRINDSLSFFGLAQDRDSHRAAEGLTVELRRQGFLEFWNRKEKVYTSVAVTADEFGFIRGELNWDLLAPGYYTVSVKRDGKEVMSRGIEVRDVVKPAYTIDVLPKKSSIYGGETIEGQVKATLFDGSPLARQLVTVELHGTYDAGSVQVTTDDSGFANFSFPTKKQSCNLNETYAYCNSVWSDTITARPVDAEEAQIQGSAYVTVWAARVSVDIQTDTKGDAATLSFLVRRVDLTKAEGREETTVLTEPVAGTALTGRVLEQEWKRFEEGTTYDYVEKKVVPRYRYELVEKEVATINLTSGSDGKVSMQMPVRNNVSYRLVVTATDDTGATDSHVTTFAKGWVDQGYDDRSIRLAPTAQEDNRPGYAVDEEVSVSFFKQGQKLPDADHPSFLFVEASRGIRNASVTNKAGYSFRFREDLVPNMTLYGIVFGPTGFVQTDYWATLDESSRKLKVIVTPDQASYAPGAKVTAAVDVRLQDGTPVSNARVSLAAVDEALLAAASGDFMESPLGTLYQGVSNGILLTRSSHDALSEKAGNGGAEFGGGGAEPIRRNFKDTAAFDVLTTDRDGRAVMSFTAPDNITTWRLTAVAMTGDLKAGAAKGKAVVTKPVFVDAVIPQTLLVADKPILKLRAFGSGLTQGEAITLTVNAPTLGVTNQVVSGTAGQSLSLGLEKLVEGDHAVTIRVTASKGSDAIERKIRILTSRMTKDDVIQTELAPGVTLPSVGESPEVDVSFLPLGRTRYLPLVTSLASSWSARLEAKVAARLAQTMLKNDYNKTDVPEPEALLKYQLSSGGLAPLPYASEDVVLSAKVAALDPTGFDRSMLANYFWSIADNEKVSREEGIQALLGLAALGEPVLNRIAPLAESTDLDWRERLGLIRALDAAGDRERARTMLEEMLKDAVTTDGLTHLRIAEDQRSIIEATAEAAALAARMSLPQASALDAYLSKNWNEDTLTDLDRAAYLSRIVPTLLAGDVAITYVADGKESTVTITDGYPETVTLTKAEAASFRTISVNGPSAAVFTRRIATPLAATTQDFSLTRRFEVDGGSLADLAEGKTVRVILTPSWKDTAQDGCYVIRDRLASGLAPVVTIFFDAYGGKQASDSYPFDIANGEVSFVTCKGQKEPIRYRARVVSRGTYVAEAASMQSMDAPSNAAITDQTTITIK